MTRPINQSGTSSSVERQPQADSTVSSERTSRRATGAPAGNGGSGNGESSAGQPILYVVALLSMSAAFIHLLVVPEHFEEWWGYGVFFLVAALLQAVFAVVVIQRPSRAVLMAGIVGNLAIVAMWVISRAVGVPYFGPGAGEIEAVGTHDVVASAAEIVLVVLLIRIGQSQSILRTGLPAEA